MPVLRAQDTDSQGSLVARTLAVTALVAAITLGWRGAELCQQDLVFTKAESEVSFWGRGQYQPDATAMQGVAHRVSSLLAGSPAQPDYLTLAASQYAWRAYWVGEAAQAREYNRRALDAQYAAQRSRPAYRRGWKLLQQYAARVETGGVEAEMAQRKMSMLQRYSNPVRTYEAAH